MLEVKADALEQSFDAFEDDGVAALKEELDLCFPLRKRGEFSRRAASARQRSADPISRSLKLEQ